MNSILFLSTVCLTKTPLPLSITLRHISIQYIRVEFSDKYSISCEQILNNFWSLSYSLYLSMNKYYLPKRLFLFNFVTKNIQFSLMPCPSVHLCFTSQPCLMLTPAPTFMQNLPNSHSFFIANYTVTWILRIWMNW